MNYITSTFLSCWNWIFESLLDCWNAIYAEVLRGIVGAAERWSALSYLQVFSCLVLSIAGIWMLVHFSCKAIFLPRTAPMAIKDSICINAGCGMYLALTAMSGQADHLLMPTMLALVCVLLFDGLLWVYRFRVCDFFKEKR